MIKHKILSGVLCIATLLASAATVNADFSGPPYIPSNVNITGGSITGLSRLGATCGTLDGTAFGQCFTATATLNTTNTANVTANTITATSAGSSSFTQTAFSSTLGAGYTGSSFTSGLSVNNSATSTGVTWSGSAAASGYRPNGANFGARILIQPSATTGNVIGVYTTPSGSSTGNYGVWSTATTTGNTPARNVGVVGLALNATTNVGGYFSLKDDGTSAPTLTNAALIADNGATTGDIIVARDNGTQIYKIDTNAHHLTSGAAPAVATGAGDCGTTPSIVGNDTAGRITVGSGANGGVCTITFAVAYTNAPICIAQDETTGVLVRPTATTTTLAITGVIVAADKLVYRCVGYF